MQNFQKEKTEFLKKRDKSKIGEIDKDIKKLVEKINSKENFYTTSSCAGRIVLLEKESKKKFDCTWIFKKHDTVKFKEIFDLLKNKKFPNPVWFIQQPLIMHVSCKDLNCAKQFLNLSRKIFKKAGIIGLNEKRVMVEIIGTEHLETIVADKNFVANEIYLKNLIRYANKNFEENKNNIGKFLEIVEEI